MSRIKFTEKYPDQGVRALSWKQPYASMMLHGKAETRTWNSKYRGWVLICASQQPYSVRDIRKISGDWQYSRIENILINEQKYGVLPTGHAIAVGYLSATKYMGDHYTDKQMIEDKTFVNYSENLWIHEYMDVQPIAPFYYKGSQGWKNLDQETIDKIILL